MIDYQVLRSHRKTLSLQVKQGLVFVRAPHHVDEKFISLFIKKKSAWLKAKITEQNQTADLCCDFTQGSKLFLFGQLVTLNIVFAESAEKLDSKNSVFLAEAVTEQPTLTVKLPTRIQHKKLDKLSLAMAVKKQLECFLKQQAEDIILPKVEFYAKLTKLDYKSIKIRQYRARWGSCNSRGELSFNYLLMMLPMQVIDYVIVHELCHLRYLNHSKHFWQLVAQHFPNYIEAQQWVKTHQSALYWQPPS
ncbi:M48 family metallopeptidase [Colwellia sp. 20A7]|uniref:M48 family metallopeptidase n=1 Tax=Colwellia sp. 20A7 TaxID=2689569 RepID=UPI00135C5689|nr:SprT family zinc-dependent metalloprotease [Colwellia sp. 20A7]